jgi:hypothetical protein
MDNKSSKLSDKPELPTKLKLDCKPLGRSV